MTLDNLFFIGAIVGIGLVALVVVGLILARLYKRASKETAFVRTGFNGQKVVKDGGAVIVPILHDTIDVNMKTLKLDVSRHGTDALLTNDQIRVDVEASFYTRVKPDEAAIAIAAQTLGDKTQNPAALKEIIENKFVDVLRSVAAQMTMNDLISKRADFSAKVREAIAHNIESNGLELEDVAVTRLDQTPVKFLDPNNVYDAAGLAAITKVTKEKEKERNDFELTTRVAIEKRTLEASQESLAIKQQQEFATLDQEREIETRRAEQESQLAKQRADRKREADVAQISADQATALARTEANQKQKEAEITATQQLRIAEQVSQIAVNEKSEAESQARAKADTARAEAVSAAESVKTAEAVASAERAKQVAIIAAQQEAAKEATKITVQAQAEAEAADLQVQARLKNAEALERELKVRAEGERQLAEAANSMSPEQVQLKIRLAAIAAAPQLVAEMAKPMSAVKNARVVAVTGLGSNGGAIAGANGSTGNVPADLTNALLNFKLQSPIVDQIGQLAGFDLKNGLAGIGANDFDFDDSTQPEAETVEAVEAPVDTATLQKLAGITPERRVKAK
ncbi:Inner membrane protein YqiK [compost metagenome]